MTQRILLLLFISTFPVLASRDATQEARTIVMSSSNIKLAYNSSLIYPGCKVGIEYPVRTIEVTRLRRSGIPRMTLKTRFIASTLCWYHHPTFHDNFYLTAEWLMRRTSQAGLVGEFASGLGYSRTILSGATYVVDEDDNVSVEPLAGYNYALATVGWGIGYDLSVKRALPLSILARLSLLVMFPYNGVVYPRPTVELGVVYRPRHFLDSKVRCVAVTRGRTK